MTTEGPVGGDLRAPWLDGDPGQPITGATNAPIGRDPFAGGDADAEPWLQALDRLRSRAERDLTRQRARAAAAAQPHTALGALLPDEARARLGRLRQRFEAHPDAFGASADVLERSLPFLLALYHGWFRVQSHGHESLPADGPAILVANHGGVLPFDGAMLATDVFLRADPPRLVRPLTDPFVGDIPGLRTFYSRIGPVLASRENLHRLLDAGEWVLVFPEGTEGIVKPLPERYRLRHFHTGFVVEALRTGAPVIPVAIDGPDDQAPVLHDASALAQRLGLPAFPITPTFPLLGPLGLLPFPVRYRIAYGSPVPELSVAPPGTPADRDVCEELARGIRARLQRMLDQLRSE